MHETVNQTIVNSKNWVYINGLGEKNAQQVADSDILSAIKFSDTGDYLALGDHGGRVIIFKRNQPRSHPSSQGKYGVTQSRYFDYKYLTEIQSHEPEFDCLKSIELDEKINAIEFLRS